MRIFPLDLVCLLLVTPAVGAQVSPKKGERPPRAEADPLAAQRRATAASLLTSRTYNSRGLSSGQQTS